MIHLLTDFGGIEGMILWGGGGKVRNMVLMVGLGVRRVRVQEGKGDGGESCVEG